MPEVRVNGVDLSYIDDGVGTPVVFVHGAWMDLRYWEPQRESVAAHHRFSLHFALPRHGPVARRREELLRSDPCRGSSGIHSPAERQPRASRPALLGRAAGHAGRARTSQSFAELVGTRAAPPRPVG